MMEVEKKEEGGGVARKPAHFGTWVAVRRPFRVDSNFFAAGNVERELLAKQVHLSFSLPLSFLLLSLMSRKWQ